MAEWCRKNRHRPLAEQHQTLSQKLRGHFAYYGITGNADALNRFRRGLIGLWRKWLSVAIAAGKSPGSDCIAC